MYIPFMTVMDISNTAMKVWETIRVPVKSRKDVQVLKDPKANKEHHGTRFAYTRKQTLHNWRNFSSSDHENMLLRLFLVFHIILGCFSLAFDIMVAMEDVQNQKACKIVDDNLGKLVNNTDWIKLHFIGLYGSIVGTFYLAMTLYYMYLQYASSLHRESFTRSIQDKKLREEKIHYSALTEAAHANERMILEAQDEFQRQMYQVENRADTASQKLDLMNKLRAQEATTRKQTKKDMEAEFKKVSNLMHFQGGRGHPGGRKGGI
jgi:hypothetical protein